MIDFFCYKKKLILIPNFISLIFSVFFVRGEKTQLDSSVKRERHIWHLFWSPESLKLVSIGSIRWENSYIVCFELQYCQEKQI